MSSDFDHMFRRACGGYRLHPKMLAHIWQPGESGNPTGANGAVRRAREEAETTAKAPKPSPSAERVRRFRQRQKQGDISVALELYQAGIDRLIELGWLRAIDRGNRNAVTAALGDFAERAFKVGVAPTSRVP